MIQGAVYNVLDYGADPTGIASSTAAIQAAINAAAATVGTPLAGASGGGVIYFPTGVYLSGALTISNPFVSNTTTVPMLLVGTSLPVHTVLLSLKSLG